MSIRVSYQPIPHLAPSDSAWAWTVSDGTFIVGRFNSKEYADKFSEALSCHQTLPRIEIGLSQRSLSYYDIRHEDDCPKAGLRGCDVGEHYYEIHDATCECGLDELLKRCR